MLEEFLLEWQYGKRSDEQNQRQLEAYHALVAQIQPRVKLPIMGGWAILPDFAQILAAHIQTHHPQTIVELGGGISTIIAGYCVEQQGFGQIISIDNSAEFSQITQQNIAAHQLTQYVEFIRAPLKSTEFEGKRLEWYDLTRLTTPLAIDLLIVDGPPQANNAQALARYPALPYFFDFLNAGAYILVDDANREDEQQMVERWLKTYTVKLVADLPTEKGTKLLQT